MALFPVCVRCVVLCFVLQFISYHTHSTRLRKRNREGDEKDVTIATSTETAAGERRWARRNGYHTHTHTHTFSCAFVIFLQEKSKAAHSQNCVGPNELLTTVSCHTLYEVIQRIIYKNDSIYSQNTRRSERARERERTMVFTKRHPNGTFSHFECRHDMNHDFRWFISLINFRSFGEAFRFWTNGIV